ncbi:hypothetical protein BACCIP111883_00896 [Sutcliffiella rhizosphaerae]|uniref:HTH merR-type domain-containing protein n=1 Tax=Sutcliffiella rhizosphaerae TaxID=2880967 RepID=A0ABM8YK13_9BACI|nr:hypothetical protein BACCIP111883_00896 [Sutcliffiella rhizosphaerae]
MAPSKLRFYDKKGLLIPGTRLENGYRAYSAEQIQVAKMIDSLRKAEISIEDIKLYFQVDDQRKKDFLTSWKTELDKKLESIQAARKYVGGMKAGGSQQLLLSKWEKEKLFVWQKFEAEKKPYPFRESFSTFNKTLCLLGIKESNQLYVRTTNSTGDKLIGEVGCELEAEVLCDNLEGVYLERIPPTLFAILENCKPDDAFFCFSYIQLVIRFGFQPAGYKLERYDDVHAETYDYFIPLVQ